MERRKKSVVYLEALGATARLFCASGIFARTKISVFVREQFSCIIYENHHVS